MFRASREAEDTGMPPFSRTKHKSYIVDFWKSEQSAVLIFQKGSTLEESHMEKHWALVRHEDLPDLVVVIKGQQQTRPIVELHSS